MRLYHLQYRKKGETEKYSLSYYKKNKERIKKLVAKYNSENPDKIKTRRDTRRAVKLGQIKKVPCEVCGSEKSEIHHPDYSNLMEVRWLCKIHHEELHRENGRILLEKSKKK